MSVKHTTVVVALDSPARTPLAALPVPGYVLQDIRVMESIVWVSQINEVSKICVCPHSTARFQFRFLHEFAVRCPFYNV